MSLWFLWKHFKFLRELRLEQSCEFNLVSHFVANISSSIYLESGNILKTYFWENILWFLWWEISGVANWHRRAVWVFWWPARWKAKGVFILNSNFLVVAHITCVALFLKSEKWLSMITANINQRLDNKLHRNCLFVSWWYWLIPQGRADTLLMQRRGYEG